MCNKLALKASQLCHLIASHSVMAVLTPYQSSHDEDHIVHLLCLNVPAFASLISSICCQYDKKEMNLSALSPMTEPIQLYYAKALSPMHRRHQPEQMLHNRSRSDKGGCQTNSVKREGDMRQRRCWVKITIGRIAQGNERR